MRVRELLLSSLRRRRRELKWLALWSAIAAVPTFLYGRLVAEAIDGGFLAGRTGTGLAWLGVLAAAVLVGAWATRQAYSRLAALVEPFRDEVAMMAVKGALARSSAGGASGETAAVARLTRQVEIVREAYGSLLMVVQTFVFTGVSALLGLLTLIPEVLVLVLPPLALGLAIFFASIARLAARQRAYILADERIAESASTIAGGLRDVVACGAEDTVHAAIGRHIDAQARVAKELARFTAVRTMAVAIGGWLPVVLILVAGPWLVEQGATTGAIVGAVTYVSYGVHSALQTLVRGLGQSVLWLSVTLSRLAEAAGDPEQRTPAGARRVPPRPLGHAVRLTRVSFSYGMWSEPVIRDLDLFVPDNDHLAVVGPSGAGKSTLAALMAGMLEPQTGEVRLGGVPLRGRDARELAALRALIPQEAYVFAGTLGENLAYLHPGARIVHIHEAVDRLGARALVERLGGYGAEVAPATLSAGERQLITLVRAYLSPARVILLDEAACHLDPRAEALVEQAFARRPGTLVVIAHRISSALRARHVVVFDATGVLHGTHEQLLVQSELYRDLVGHWQPAGHAGSNGAQKPGPLVAGLRRP